MSESNITPIQFTIHIESQEYDHEDSEWQDECRKFYTRMVEALEEGQFEPAKQKAPEGAKTDFVEMFNQIIAYGISGGAFAAMYQLVQLWLEHRSRCDIVLKFPDSSEMKMRGLSWKDAEQKMQEHQRKHSQKETSRGNRDDERVASPCGRDVPNY